MDEAERCHRLAYIAYGSLLTHGTVGEVVQGANLTTYEVSGPQLYRLADQLRSQPGVEQVVAFGNTLHVSGRNAQPLCDSLAPAQAEPYRCRPVTPGLEDVFISLMETAGDNFK
jgi:ABC-2 type transport system ATP-binding protein